VIAVETEEVVDLIVDEEEALGLAGHAAWLMISTGNGVVRLSVEALLKA
jgi:hypothetical protein